MKTEKEIQIYFDGYRDAVTDFGIWENGVQRIGCLETPIKKILEQKRIELGLPAQPFIPNALKDRAEKQ